MLPWEQCSDWISPSLKTGPNDNVPNVLPWKSCHRAFVEPVCQLAFALGRILCAAHSNFSRTGILSTARQQVRFGVPSKSRRCDTRPALIR